MITLNNKQRGFTLLELVIVIIIVVSLFSIAIDKLLKLEVQAEKASMQQVLGQMKSGLGLNMSDYIAKDNIKGMKVLINSNPMDLLIEPPHNYQGEIKGEISAQTDDLKPSSWYFRKSDGVLFYVVDNIEYFHTNNSEKYLAKFKIRAVYDDNNNNKRFDARDTLKGLRLEAINDYRWLREPKMIE